MSEDELAAIRRRKLHELQKRHAFVEKTPSLPDDNKVLNGIFGDRAWEVYNAAASQFPDTMNKLRKILVSLALSGKLVHVNGEELYLFLRKIGLNVKLNTKISYESHGQLKSLEEKMKEEIQRP